MSIGNTVLKAGLFAASLLATSALASQAFAFDGWHTENVTIFDTPTAFYDYITFDAGTKHLFLGHRKAGVHVFDVASHKMITTIAGTTEHSGNGATLIPDMDLGIANNEDGSFISFKLSTLAAQPAVKISTGIDTSHYDTGTKRIVFNVDPEKDGVHVVVVDAATLKTAGTIAIPSQKVEGAVSDGKGKFFLLGQDVGKIFVLDTMGLKITATWTSPTCAKPTATDIDTADNRLFIACRGTATVKPSMVVLNTETGATVWSSEIGEGSDGLIYDAAMKRIFSANGVGANLSVAEQTGPDNYKMVETLATMNNVKVLAMDHAGGKLYSMVAEGTNDTAKKGNLAISPFFINSVFPNTFRVITYSK